MTSASSSPSTQRPPWYIHLGVAVAADLVVLLLDVVGLPDWPPSVLTLRVGVASTSGPRWPPRTARTATANSSFSTSSSGDRTGGASVVDQLELQVGRALGPLVEERLPHRELAGARARSRSSWPARDRAPARGRRSRRPRRSGRARTASRWVWVVVPVRPPTAPLPIGVPNVSPTYAASPRVPVSR